MSARVGHPALRARISESLDTWLRNQRPSDVASMLGRAHSTITRRGPDLREWPADELLHIATKDPQVSACIQTYLVGEEVSGDARHVDAGLMDGLAALGQTISATAEAMKDRHCDPREAVRLLPLVQQAQAQLAQAAKDLAEQIRLAGAA